MAKVAPNEPSALEKRANRATLGVSSCKWLAPVILRAPMTDEQKDIVIMAWLLPLGIMRRTALVKRWVLLICQLLSAVFSVGNSLIHSIGLLPQFQDGHDGTVNIIGIVISSATLMLTAVEAKVPAFFGDTEAKADLLEAIGRKWLLQLKKDGPTEEDVLELVEHLEHVRHGSAHALKPTPKGGGSSDAPAERARTEVHEF